MLIWGVHVHVGRAAPRARDADRVVAAELVPAPAGAVRLLADLGRHRHRLRQQPGDDVPAAADGRAAVPVRDLGRSTRRTPTTSCTTGVIEDLDEIRWDVRPAPHLGTVEVRISDGVSDVRRDAGAGGADPLPGGRPRRPARRRGAAADDAAVARAGEQVAGRALRPRRLDHPRRRRPASACSSTTSPTCSSGWPRWPAGSAAPTSWRWSRRSRAAARRTSGSAGGRGHRWRPGRGGGLGGERPDVIPGYPGIATVCRRRNAGEV